MWTILLFRRWYHPERPTSTPRISTGSYELSAMPAFCCPQTHVLDVCTLDLHGRFHSSCIDPSHRSWWGSNRLAPQLPAHQIVNARGQTLNGCLGSMNTPWIAPVIVVQVVFPHRSHKQPHTLPPNRTACRAPQHAMRFLLSAVGLILGLTAALSTAIEAVNIRNLQVRPSVRPRGHTWYPSAGLKD